ncbi:hypothetical protein B7P43_G17590 [Cryptotermes secundus]|uniref:Tc1-like transposase DDE domain-containing protein n=1 Tax=Cryptotermes secundus TaxID=105785 RepID=A0A2J7Q091_9NEOP|nr:hypothetical protein B7P43_G17590 [Cryptotermes secundus]
MQMFHRIQDDEKLLDSVIFSGESRFHVSGKVNTHNCRIWGSGNPRVSLEHVRDSPKVKVFCALSKERVYGPFSTWRRPLPVYLDMLPEFLTPKLDEDDQVGRIHFQQDGAPPHYLGEVREYLNSRFPGRWIGIAAPKAWPPRSPDLTPLDFFSYGDSLKIECSYRLCLQMSLSSELELLPQLQKRDQRCYVACGKRLTTGGTSAALAMEVTVNHNYPR